MIRRATKPHGRCPPADSKFGSRRRRGLERGLADHVAGLSLLRHEWLRWVAEVAITIEPILTGGRTEVIAKSLVYRTHQVTQDSGIARVI